MNESNGKIFRVLGLVVVCGWVVYLSVPHQTVRTESTESPGATFTVTNTNDDGPGSLRQAIVDANASAGVDTIEFAIGSGPVTITAESVLPEIFNPVIIDGTTQPGYSGDPLISLTNSGGEDFGLKITGGQSIVKALMVGGALNGIVLENAGGNTIHASRIAGNFSNGILINNSPNNVIGGAAVADRNIIGSNSNAGVQIDGAASMGNEIVGNYIGVAPNGTSQLINGNYGIFINDAPGNRIGGANPGEGNLISGTGQGTMDVLDAGIRILGAGASGNIVQGNRIGPNAAGTGTITNRQHGIRIDGAANSVVGGSIGTTPGGACTGACNLISGNIRGGITITGAGSTNTSILGNFIGPNVLGTSSLNNAGAGVLITDAASNTTIGGTTAAARNLISNGVGMTNGAAMNTLQGNYLGTDTIGETGFGFVISTGAAVLIDSSANNTIGIATGTTFGGACTGGCNLISGNNGFGVLITGSASSGNQVDYNYLGLNAAGTAALRNNSDAVYLRNGAHHNTIGRVTQAEIAGIKTTRDLRAGSSCTQDDATGDFVEWSEDGTYSAFECRSGRSRVGVGEVKESSPGVFELYDNGMTVTSGGAELLFPGDEFNRDLFISDSDPGGACGPCRSAGDQPYVGTITVGEIGSTSPHNNSFAGLSCNLNSTHTASLTEVGGTCFLLRNCESNDFRDITAAMAPNGVNQDVPAFTLINGNGNTISDIEVIRLSRAIDGATLEFDLNSNDIHDPNDPLDADNGANNTQNHPVVFVTANLNGGVRVQGSLHGTPNKRFRINLLIDDLVVGVLQFFSVTSSTVQDTGLTFETTTGPDGNSPFFDVKYTGADADKLRVFAESLRATATVLPDSGSLSPATTVPGDTSELSPPAKMPSPKFDFDEDGKTDIAVYRPGAAAGEPSFWYILNSSDSSFRTVQFGIGEDVIVTGDYQGDGVADFAVWRPSTGVWYHSRLTGNPSTNFVSTQWGLPTDVPVLGDYDDDGVNDPAVFRPSEQTWYIRQSLTGTPLIVQYGLATDKLVPGDYSGDGRTDFAVYRDGIWYISACAGCPLRVEHFGLATDQPVPGVDWDGDGEDDITVARNDGGSKVWYWLESSTGEFRGVQFGVASDIVVPGDYDADNKTDLAVFRPSNGVWYILRSELGFTAFQWGAAGDTPVPRIPGP